VEAKQNYLMGFVNIGGAFWGLFQELPSLLRVHAGRVSQEAAQEGALGCM